MCWLQKQAPVYTCRMKPGARCVQEHWDSMYSSRDETQNLFQLHPPVRDISYTVGWWGEQEVVS